MELVAADMYSYFVVTRKSHVVIYELLLDTRENNIVAYY